MPRLLQYSDLENVYDEPERAARVAGAIQSLDGPDALVVGTGDNVAPGVLPLVERGRQALTLFEAFDADYETFGNHDFDFGPDATARLVADAPQTWLSANVQNGDGGAFAAAAGVVPWTLHEVDGVRVGLFGVTDPATDSLNPQAAGLRFTEPVTAARDAVDALRDAGADYVVALSHLGAGDDALARRTDVDVVLGGHVHAERVERVDGVPVTRPGANGHVVLEVSLDDGAVSVQRHETATAPADRSVASAFEGRIEAAGLNEVVAHADSPLVRDEETVFGGECRVGNLVADAYRWAADADVGLQNSGGVRAGPPLAGDVTRADLVSVVPFEEPVVVAALDGDRLLDLFGEAAGEVDFGESDWWHAHVSGAQLVWDRDRDELHEATVGGEPVDPDARYTVATADYLLHTDHEFPTLDQSDRVGERGIQHEVLADYVERRGLDVAVEGRIRWVDVETDA
jgi:2',3'-cyclic-nucleotide 2'-phosphodiesterase (5'-nucleotidase family)